MLYTRLLVIHHNTCLSSYSNISYHPHTVSAAVVLDFNSQGVDEHLTRLLGQSARGALTIGKNRIQISIAETQTEFFDKKKAGQISHEKEDSGDDAESVAASEAAQEKTREYREMLKKQKHEKFAEADKQQKKDAKRAGRQERKADKQKKREKKAAKKTENGKSKRRVNQ